MKLLDYWLDIVRRREQPSSGLRSIVCQSKHFDTSWYKRWAEAIHTGGADLNRFGPEFALTYAKVWEAMEFKNGAPKYRHRKMWEWCAIAQALHERGKLTPGSQACGFAVGHEPLASLFAASGVNVLATDFVVQEETDWNATGQQVSTASQIWWPNLLPQPDFDQRVRFRSADMRDLGGLPQGAYDFVWSSCSLEHLGSLKAGLKFIEDSVILLKPGGVAVHTTEFNVSSNASTIETGDAVVYRKKDLLTLPNRLSAKGADLEPLQFFSGITHPDRECDLPPYYTTGRHHVKLKFKGYVVTSIMLVITRSNSVGGVQASDSKDEGETSVRVL